MAHMTREDALSLLRGGTEGIREWNKRRIYGQEVLELSGADLSGLDLRWVNLRKARLADADLSRANLSYATLMRADLQAASFIGAKASYADFRDANASGAVLGGCDLGNANLRSVSLAHADFSGAILGYTTLASSLAEADGLNQVDHVGPSEISMRCALSVPPDAAQKFLRGVGLADAQINRIRDESSRPEQFASVFISYCHDDGAFASQLHDRLQNAGIRCWLDQHDALPGQKIHEAIDRAIRDHDRVLLCCSRQSPFLNTPSAA